MPSGQYVMLDMCEPKVMGGTPTQWSSLKPSTRARVIGVAVLVAGLVGAAVLYWIGSRRAGPGIDELLPGYSRNRERQVGILMGGFVVTLLEWFDALKDFRVQAAIVAGVAALVAAVCFWMAPLFDRRPSDSEPWSLPADKPR
jgi:hypothetical protein